MTSDLPASYSQLLQLPLHKIDHAAPGDSATLGPEQGMPRRSLSQSLLAQMSGPAFGMSRSTSPSPLLNSLRRGGNRSGFGSHGPSLQSLVQSFVNKVSRGTQTDCDDNFDQISIASAATGFSVMASDLTRNRIKMFLNDRTAAANEVDVNEFAEELHKLRYQIDGRFRDFPDDAQSVQFDDLEFEQEVKSTSYSPNSLAPGDKFSNVVTAVETCHVFTETEPVLSQDFSSQTVEPEPCPPTAITTTTTSNSVQTDPEPSMSVNGPNERQVPVQMHSVMVETKPKLREIETQTEDSVQFCQHCAGLDTVQRELLLNGDLLRKHDPLNDRRSIQQNHLSAPATVHKYEFLISNANIICRDDNFQAKIQNLIDQPTTGSFTNFKLSNGSLTPISEQPVKLSTVPGTAVPTSSANPTNQNGVNQKVDDKPEVKTDETEKSACKTATAPKVLTNGKSTSSYETDYGITEHAKNNRKTGPKSKTATSTTTAGARRYASPAPTSPSTNLPANGATSKKTQKSPSKKKHIIAANDDDNDPNAPNAILLSNKKADPKCCSIT